MKNIGLVQTSPGLTEARRGWGSKPWRGAGVLRIRSHGGKGAAVGRQLVRSQVCTSWQGYKDRRAANSSKSLGCAAACLALARDPPVVLVGTTHSQEQGNMKGPQ